MRFVGMFLLGLGIVLLILSGFAFANAGGLREVLGFLLCAALVPFPMIFGGIFIIRRVESNIAQPIEEPESPSEIAQDPIGRIRTRLRRFDLNRLNWIGWLLLLATFAFVLAESLVATLVLKDGPWGGRVLGRLFAFGAVFLAIGFFVGARWLLGLFGISIYRW